MYGNRRIVFISLALVLLGVMTQQTVARMAALAAPAATSALARAASSHAAAVPPTIRKVTAKRVYTVQGTRQAAARLRLAPQEGVAGQVAFQVSLSSTLPISPLLTTITATLQRGVEPPFNLALSQATGQLAQSNRLVQWQRRTAPGQLDLTVAIQATAAPTTADETWWLILRHLPPDATTITTLTVTSATGTIAQIEVDPQVVIDSPTYSVSHPLPDQVTLRGYSVRVVEPSAGVVSDCERVALHWHATAGSNPAIPPITTITTTELVGLGLACVAQGTVQRHDITAGGRYTYTLQATTGAFSNQAEAALVVTLPPTPTIDFIVQPAAFERGALEMITLTWKTTDTDLVTIEPGLGSVALSGVRTAPAPLETTTYTLKAQGPGGEAIGRVRVEVTEPRDTTAPTVTIAHAPATPTSDDTITFVAEAADVESGVERIEIWVNDEHVQSCISEAICQFLGGPYAAGEIHYQAVAIDREQNRAATGAQTIPILAIVEPEPLLYLPFDGDIEDHATNALDTYSVGSIEFVPGVHGQAVQIDGTGEHVYVPAVTNLPITDEMTLEFWVKMADWKNPYPGSAHVEQIAHLGLFYGIKVWFDTWELEAHLTTDQTGDDYIQLRGGRLQPEQWHHLALVYQGKKNQALLYLDGEQVAEQTVSGMVPPNNPNPLKVGTWYEQNEAFAGLVDELYLYNVGLGAGLIRDHARKPAITPTAINLNTGATVTGKVFWNDAPLEGIKVSIGSEQSAVTAADGSFWFTNAPVGAFWIGTDFTETPPAAPYWNVARSITIAANEHQDIGVLGVAKFLRPLSPAAGEQLVTNKPMLTWEPFADPIQYNVLIRLVKDSGEEVIIREVTHDTAFQVTTPLTNGTYVWFVDAMGAPLEPGGFYTTLASTGLTRFYVQAPLCPSDVSEVVTFYTDDEELQELGALFEEVCGVKVETDPIMIALNLEPDIFALKLTEIGGMGFADNNLLHLPITFIPEAFRSRVVSDQAGNFVGLSRATEPSTVFVISGQTQSLWAAITLVLFLSEH